MLFSNPSNLVPSPSLPWPFRSLPACFSGAAPAVLCPLLSQPFPPLSTQPIYAPPFPALHSSETQRVALVTCELPVSLVTCLSSQCREREMAWKGSSEEESGLELSLGLPGYFSGSQGQAGSKEEGNHGAAGAKGRSTGSKTSRTLAAAPVVGWPPVRSFRRNLASSSSKRPPADPRNGADDKAGYKGLFVKVNMDGVPIGRKVDLKAHDSYGGLSLTVDRLFRDLLAAQMDQRSCAGENQPSITGLLDGSGEYTLVYEDDEGDQMLVGDVPWGMFIATAKRLRVLRSSDLNASSLRAAVSRKRGAADY